MTKIYQNFKHDQILMFCQNSWTKIILNLLKYNKKILKRNNIQFYLI